MAQQLTKPILRGHVKAWIIKSFLVSSAISLFFGWSYKHWVADPRKKAYADFYKDYNAEEEGDRLYKMGLIRGWADNEDVPDEKVKLPSAL